jgi:hypothetical protein
MEALITSAKTCEPRIEDGPRPIMAAMRTHSFTLHPTSDGRFLRLKEGWETWDIAKLAEHGAQPIADLIKDAVGPALVLPPLRFVNPDSSWKVRLAFYGYVCACGLITSFAAELASRRAARREEAATLRALNIDDAPCARGDAYPRRW